MAITIIATTIKYLVFIIYIPRFWFYLFRASFFI